MKFPPLRQIWIIQFRLIYSNYYSAMKVFFRCFVLDLQSDAYNSALSITSLFSKAYPRNRREQFCQIYGKRKTRKGVLIYQNNTDEFLDE